MASFLSWCVYVSSPLQMQVSGVTSNTVNSLTSPKALLPSESTEWRLMKDYDLLYCFRRDSNKVQNYLKILKCRIVPDHGCWRPETSRKYQHVGMEMLRLETPRITHACSLLSRLEFCCECGHCDFTTDRMEWVQCMLWCCMPCLNKIPYKTFQKTSMECLFFWVISTEGNKLGAYTAAAMHFQPGNHINHSIMTRARPMKDF